MSRNIEIKARLSESQFASILNLATDLAGGLSDTLKQKDTYFDAPNGRLKLREFDGGSAELIGYQREDCLDPTASHYYRTSIANTEDVENLIQSLKITVGIRSVVRKTRQLFLCDRTRIHLDQVDSLGKFIELEVVLSENQTDQEGIETAHQLMAKLSIPESQLITDSYIDLLEQVVA
ncbi:MAG: class IV adenylate cyclase [Planctomycetota bacterium]